ncbi:MAG: cupin domain-containing protein [Desulfobulbus sp.]|nr:cupin domain-containing protein [Desulfobulbus sp.]
MAMNKRILGKTGLEVSTLGLGYMSNIEVEALKSYKGVHRIDDHGTFLIATRSMQRSSNMKTLAAAVISLALLTPAFAHANQGRGVSGEAISHGGASRENTQTIKITRNGTQPSVKGTADKFSGSVRIDQMFEASDPARLLGASVTFEPGARTAWHSHPLGQTLIVRAGCGLVQRQGGPIDKILPGDVVWIPPHVKHWHGAAPTTSMTHIALVERLDGRSAAWMEKVTDEQYSGKEESSRE